MFKTRCGQAAGFFFTVNKEASNRSCKSTNFPFHTRQGFFLFFFPFSFDFGVG